MDLKQIRYFVNLADTLNFTRAAELSDVSQPALTKGIQKLEEELGGLLVYRDGRDTRLTELGRTIRGDFEAIIRSEMRARELASLVTQETRIMISIGVSSTVGPEPVWPFLEAFLTQEDNVEAIITPVNPNMAHQLVLSGAIDACFCNQSANDNPKLQSIELYRERLLLAIPREHRFAQLDAVPLKELRHEKYIDRINCEFRAAVIDYFMDHDALQRPRLQSDREDWVRAAVANGFGITITPEFASASKEVLLKQVSGLELSRQIDLLTVFGSATSPAIKRLRDAAKNYIWPSLKS